MNIFNYIKGNVFESEVINYLRSKLGIDEGINKELPNVFYTIKDDDHKFFYNEFDSIFVLNNIFVLDQAVVKINCKYEKKLFENSKIIDKNNLMIEGKNVVFVECKQAGDFYNYFTNLLEKVYKFRRLIDDIFNIKDYGTKILYLYDDIFIYKNVCFNRFCSTIKDAIDNCVKRNMNDVENYDILAFYINSNVHLYNYENIEKELKAVKIQQEKDRLQREEDRLQIEQYSQKVNNLESQIQLLMQKYNNNQNLQDNETAKKDGGNGQTSLKQSKISLKKCSNKYEKVNDNKIKNDNIFKNSDGPEKNRRDDNIMKNDKNN